MNTLFVYIAILLNFFATENPKLTINIQNIKSLQGEIRIGVFDSDIDFLEEGKAIKGYVVSVSETSEQIIINDLPAGEYAISLYHDKNSDGICNLNFFGIPKEPYGFSNNFRPRFSAPKYSDCKFLLETDKIINIKLSN